MKKLINRLRNWFEQLSLRERTFFGLLVWAVIYAVFSLLFLRPVNNQRAVYLDKIKIAKSQVKNLELQLDAVDKIANSPLYLEWKKQHVIYEKIQMQYKRLISNFSSNDWHEVIKTVIASHSNITLAQVENSQETPFAPESMPITETTLFEQRSTIVVYADYFSFIKYLEYIETALPNVHWDALKYEVVTYPTAKITMEFSVFYGKSVKS